MMQKVMRQIIANIPKYTSTVCRYRCMPVVGDDGMRELPERSSEDKEKGWWHDEAVPVHGEVVVDAMEKEVQGYGNAVVWH
jgi:hypothetical protein